MLAPYKQGIDTQMQAVVGMTDIPLTKAQPECTLGNFLADAQLKAAQKIDPKVVAAIANQGGIRLTYIAPGNITREKIFELMPFDNMLTIAEISGADLQKFCDKIAAAKGWPVSGIRFMIKDKKAEQITINDQPLNNSLVYKIALNDYIANGGDNCTMLVRLKKKHTTVFIRDALLDYLAALTRDHKPLHPTLEKRISYAE
jgi:2',3'-cyclic-nucleotide 2'-phosphodiesterase (5'-nucleotidase family)